MKKKKNPTTTLFFLLFINLKLKNKRENKNRILQNVASPRKRLICDCYIENCCFKSMNKK